MEIVLESTNAVVYRDGQVSIALFPSVVKDVQMDTVLVQITVSASRVTKASHVISLLHLSASLM